MEGRKGIVKGRDLNCGRNKREPTHQGVKKVTIGGEIKKTGTNPSPSQQRRGGGRGERLLFQMNSRD